MAKKQKQVRRTKYFKLWSPSIIGSIYFDNDGNWWVYEEKQGIVSGISSKEKGKKAKVVPLSYERDERRLRGVI